jgi:hypothetical protein
MRRALLATLFLLVSASSALAKSGTQHWVRQSGDGFSILFPNAAFVVTKQEELPAGRLDIESQLAADGTDRYILTVTRVPQSLLGALSADQFLESYAKGLPGADEATVRKESFRNYTGVVIDRSSPPTRSHQRAFLVGDRLFAMTVEWPNDQPQPSTVREFEDSLRLSTVGASATPMVQNEAPARSPLMEELRVESQQFLGWIAPWAVLGVLVGAAVLLSLRFRLFEI